MLKERLIKGKESFKNHIKRNKNKYYVCGLIGVAGVTFIVTKRITLRKMSARHMNFRIGQFYDYIKDRGLYDDYVNSSYSVAYSPEEAEKAWNRRRKQN